MKNKHLTWHLPSWRMENGEERDMQILLFVRGNPLRRLSAGRHYLGSLPFLVL